jgi:predicted AAA+ superfamily ATPase
LRNSLARSDRLSAYVSTFLERDLPTLGIGLPARRLRALWTMLTHVHGNLLNVSDLARSLGVSFHTLAGDLDVPEDAYMVRRLPPYHANLRKRLTKSVKLYVRDTGLLHFLAGLRRPPELATWSKGARRSKAS